MHELPLITTIAVAFTAAWLLGLLTNRLRLSPIVGYLVAGVLLGPATPGFVADVDLAGQLAEVGVILLMFGVGLHFHWRELAAVRGVAIPGAVFQSLVATLLALLLFTALGISLKAALITGLALAVASTVVLMRVLIDADVLNSTDGHIAVGWLLVEDIFTVIILVLIPALAGSDTAATQPAEAGGSVWISLGWALLKLAALVILLVLAGKRLVPWVLTRIAQVRSRELFTLTVLVFSVAVAAGAYAFFGASMALGAFLAGMMVAQSPVSHQAAADALPLRDAFAVLFFVSVGMLFDPALILQQPLLMLAALFIILIAKPLSALLIVLWLGYSVRSALTVAIGLAQIGEFSFILASVARDHSLITPEGQSLLVGAAILSIALNPLLFRQIPRIERLLQDKTPRLWQLLSSRSERRGASLNASLGGELAARAAERVAILVGYGPVGRAVHGLLREAGLRTVVVDLNLDTIRELRSTGQLAIYGDAANPHILAQAGVERASHLVLTLPHSAARASIVAAARDRNRHARILVRARYLRERADLEQAGATAAVFEEAEAAVALARLVLADTGAHEQVAASRVQDLRLQLVQENFAGMRARRVRSVMVPWTRVHRLFASASRSEVLRQIADQRFARWPVLDSGSGQVRGYLLARDLLLRDDPDWTQLIRPLHVVAPDDDVASTLLQMQAGGVTVAVVQEGDTPLGLLTLEDILEQVVGRIEDEYPRDSDPMLAAALDAGAIVLNLAAADRDAAIEALARAIPPERLPPGTDVTRLALEREAQVATDLGMGVAIPHARCPGLAGPLVVLGRSAAGVTFSAHSPPVRLIFLLVTPADQPTVQLALLSQIATAIGDEQRRRQLLEAHSASDVRAALAEGAAAPLQAR